jgi:hypothetical protein
MKQARAGKPEPHFGFPFPFPGGVETLTRTQDAAHRPQELQLSHKPPRHEKDADTDPDGEQHSEHRTTHPVDPATTQLLRSGQPK